MKVCNYIDAEPVTELPGVVKREVITGDDGASAQYLPGLQRN